MTHIDVEIMIVEQAYRNQLAYCERLKRRLEQAKQDLADANRDAIVMEIRLANLRNRFLRRVPEDEGREYA